MSETLSLLGRLEDEARERSEDISDQSIREIMRQRGIPVDGDKADVANARGFYGHDTPKGTPHGGGSIAENATEIRRLRASKSFVPFTARKQHIADASEFEVAKAIDGQRLGDAEVFDVITTTHAVEVKTIIDGRHPKITMHPESLRDKLDMAKRNKMEAWTVVIDRRDKNRKYYVKKGVGSFRLTTMQQIGSLKELPGIMGTV